MTTLTTVEQVVDALGGTQKTADLTGRTRQAVTNWKLRGKIAPETYVLISAKLATIGKPASPALWGMESEDSQ